MARPTGSTNKSAEARFQGNRANAGDPAPETDEISGTRADYAPVGADPKPTTGGTIKRTLKEFSEDNLTDWAAALTYYGVLAVFPALVALLSIIGLLVDPKTLTDALTAVVPGSASDALSPVIDAAGEQRQRRRLRPDPRSGRRRLVGLGLRRCLHPRGQRRLRDARRPQGLEAQAPAAAGHPDRHHVRRHHPGDPRAQRSGGRRHRAGPRDRRDGPDRLEHRQVARGPRAAGADDRRPLLRDPERAAARLQVGQPRCRRRHPRRDRRVGAVRVLRGELRQLQQDLRDARRRRSSS